jgi:hypothetical protein
MASKTFLVEAGIADGDSPRLFAKIILEDVPDGLLGEHGSLEHAVRLIGESLQTVFITRCSLHEGDRSMTVVPPRAEIGPAWMGNPIIEEEVTNEQLDAERAELLRIGTKFNHPHDLTVALKTELATAERDSLLVYERVAATPTA